MAFRLYLTLRHLSHLLLLLQAIFLFFLTFIAVVFLLGASGQAWSAAWLHQRYEEPLYWMLIVAALTCAWWLLLAYFYGGHAAARRAPLEVWILAGLAATFAVWDAATAKSGLNPAILFVPTFLHLAGEVWLWPPRDSQGGTVP